MTTTKPGPVTYDSQYERPYDIHENGSGSWLTRGANMVIAVTPVKGNVRLTRTAHPDEYMVLLDGVAGTIAAGGATIQAGDDSLTIVPPGDSSLELSGEGYVVRVFSSNATDLLDAAGNAPTYAHGAPLVAPLKAWSAPQDGYRLRHYRLADHTVGGSNLRIFRTCNLMVNALTRRLVPRDIHKLTPHSHADFEQASLALHGDYVHHIRHPWVPDMDAWHDDVHAQMASPSVLVVPPTVVHTSRNISDGMCWLVDIFAPPRRDFSLRPGLVRNGNEYPMPEADPALVPTLN